MHDPTEQLNVCKVVHISSNESQIQSMFNVDTSSLALFAKIADPSARVAG